MGRVAFLKLTPAGVPSAEQTVRLPIAWFMGIRCGPLIGHPSCSAPGKSIWDSATKHLLASHPRILSGQPVTTVEIILHVVVPLHTRPFSYIECCRTVWGSADLEALVILFDSSQTDQNLKDLVNWFIPYPGPIIQTLCWSSVLMVRIGCLKTPG